MSSSLAYVAIPRCPMIFDGTNYPDFAAFMRVHMRGLRLWGLLSGEVSYPPCPTARLLFRRLHLFSVMMLLRLLLRVLIGVLLLHMICSFSSTLVPLRPIGWI
jgi:hypothetical protein